MLFFAVSIRQLAFPTNSEYGFKAAKQELPLFEIRQDVTTGDYVIIATDRANRPLQGISCSKAVLEVDKTPHCPFCEGNESLTPPEVFAVRDHGRTDTPGWRVRIVPNKYPALHHQNHPSMAENPLFPKQPAMGVHEVVIETPVHNGDFGRLSDSDICAVFRAISDRQKFFYNLPFVKSVALFKNHGPMAGSSLMHPHWQIATLPMVPPAISRRLERLDDFYKQHGQCILCKMAQEEIISDERILFEKSGMVVFHPFASRFPFETWVMPVIHAPTLVDLNENELEAFALALRDAVAIIQKALGPFEFNISFIDGANAIDPKRHFHFFARIIPRRNFIAGFELGTDTFMNTHAPEQTAKFCRTLIK